ncbi:unnamed protein product [Periconia digitata]|uniref:alpha,alpha-trehalase n=1 Tax=Periconia digitata TaxID=1303443 RepID=A0A9W4UPX0_9PLEO|nr:unnamed protein product [Periconia digitata]
MWKPYLQTALSLLGITRLTPFAPTTTTTTTTTTTDHVIQIGDVTWDDDAWILSTHSLTPGNYKSRMTLANGYIGLSVAAAGPFFEVDRDSADTSGWPLFTPRQAFGTIAGFYADVEKLAGTNYEWLNQYGWESVVSGLPHWSGLLVEAHGELLDARVDPQHISNFSTSLNVETAELRWGFVWRPGGEHEGIEVEYRMHVNKLVVNSAAVQLNLTAAQDVDVVVYDVLDGMGAVRTEFVEKGFEEDSVMWTAVSPLGQPDVTAYVYSTIWAEVIDLEDNVRPVTDEDVFWGTHAASIGQAAPVTLHANRTLVFGKYVGIASSDAFPDPQSTARDASMFGVFGYEEWFEQHVAEWRSILPKHTVDSYRHPNGTLPTDRNLQEMHITSVTNPFMILQNTVGPNAAVDNTKLNIHSIPVCGLGSDCYGGLIFWDAGIWMALGLQVSHPDNIRSVVNYRVEKHPQAKENIKMAYTSSKNQTGRFTGGAVYPWTSGRHGNCTGIGPCFDYEYHVNGDIAISLRNEYAVTGDAEKYRRDYLPIANDIAYFYGEMLDYNATSGHYEIWNATDPDEYANNKNNVGFTTALIQKHLEETNEMNVRFNLPTNKTWLDIVTHMQPPTNEDVGIILEYDTMNGSIVVKQADVVLTDDILHYANPYSLGNLDYYANKQSSDGPGMTYAAFSIVANAVSPSGCSSFTYALYSQQPYLRLPWFQYSEQIDDDFTTNGGTHPAFPFLTGMGGSNRIGIFGYLGLRLFIDRLEVEPSLPPQITYFKYRTFYWQGYAITAWSNTTHTSLQRLPNLTLPTANPAYATSPIPITLHSRRTNYSLPTTSPLVLPNRMIGQTPTAPRNILQCHPVSVSSFPPSSSSLPPLLSSQPPNNHKTCTSPILPGQFPLAATDGASSTKYQPCNASLLHYLTIDLGPHHTPHRIHSILLDWAAVPPAYYEVLFSNTTLLLPPPTLHFSSNLGDGRDRGGFGSGLGLGFRKAASGVPEISEPWDPETVFDIVKVKGNQTNVTFVDGDAEEVWSGRFAHLGIWGRLDGEMGKGGAMVAEWSVVRWED